MLPGMTKDQIDAAFAGFENAAGLPGTRLEHFLRDLRASVERLISHDDVVLTHLKLFRKSRDAESRFATLGAYHRIAIDPEVKSFYQQTDGLQMRWLNKKHPRFDPKADKKISKKGFDYSLIDLDRGKSRTIHIPNSDLFLSTTLGSYLSFKQGEGYQLYYLDYASSYRQVAFNLNVPEKRLDLVVGRDGFSEVEPLNRTFAEYVTSLLSVTDAEVAAAAIE